MTVFKKCQLVLILMIAFAAYPYHAFSQDNVKPPKEDASRAELEKWIVHALGKHASYRTSSMSVSVERVKLTGCTIAYSVVRRSNPVNNDTVNAVLKTKGVRTEVDLDVARIESNGIEIVDHVLPEFQTVVIRESFGASVPPAAGTSRLVEIVVKHEAAAAIKTALERFRDHCAAPG
jgi:hypothetical protein